MKRVEFSITSKVGDTLREPAFVETCSELPLAIMRAVEDFLEAHGGQLNLPITIQVQPGKGSAKC